MWFRINLSFHLCALSRQKIHWQCDGRCVFEFAGIYITIVGNAECLWSENSGDKRIAYRGKECYLSTRIYFVGEEDGKLCLNFSSTQWWIRDDYHHAVYTHLHVTSIIHSFNILRVVNNEICVCHPGEPITLKPDVYKYSFKCQLPDELPTSMEGTFGSIRYAAIVTINVPIWPDKVFEKGFTVVKAVNLNEMFELKVINQISLADKRNAVWIKWLILFS